MPSVAFACCSKCLLPTAPLQHNSRRYERENLFGQAKIFQNSIACGSAGEDNRGAWGLEKACERNRAAGMSTTSGQPLTRLLSQAQQGDRKAASDLLPLVYEQLRELARQRMA